MNVLRGSAILVLAFSLVACELDRYDRRGLWLTNETDASVFVLERRWAWYWVLAPGDTRAGWAGIGPLVAEVEIRNERCEVIDVVALTMKTDTVLVVDQDGASTTRGYLDTSMPIQELPSTPCP